MNPMNAVSGDREEMIVRLRHLVAEGLYQPSVEDLIDRLMSAVMVRRGSEPLTRSLR